MLLLFESVIIKIPDLFEMICTSIINPHKISSKFSPITKKIETPFEMNQC
jgi:hypothetical protein